MLGTVSLYLPLLLKGRSAGRERGGERGREGWTVKREREEELERSRESEEEKATARKVGEATGLPTLRVGQ